MLDRGRPKANLNKSSQGIAVAAFVAKGRCFVVQHCENDKSWIAVGYLSRKSKQDSRPGISDSGVPNYETDFYAGKRHEASFPIAECIGSV